MSGTMGSEGVLSVWVETTGQTSLTLYSTGLASRCAGFKHFSEEATRSSQRSTECGGRRGGHSPELWVRNVDKWLYLSEVQLSLYKEEIVTSASGRGMETRSVKASRRGVSHTEMLAQGGFKPRSPGSQANLGLGDKQAGVRCWTFTWSPTWWMLG